MIGPATVEFEEVMATSAACEVLGRSRATHYRRRQPQRDPVVVRHRRQAGQPRALSHSERAEVLEVLHSDRFVDESPATVWATLLDEGTYLVSPATMYRLLRDTNGGVVERRRQATHPPRSRPELVAKAPQRRVVLGHHPPPWPRSTQLLLPVCVVGSVLSLRAGLDARICRTS